MIEWKDAILLFFGFVVGIPASMVAAWVLGPIATIFCGFHVTKIFSALRKKVKRDEIFDQAWRQTWCVDSSKFQRSNSSPLNLYKIMHIVAGEATMVTSTGQTISFRIIGAIDSNRYITGKWMDPEAGGYYGAFQLIMDPTRESAAGTWVGFSSSGTVKSGSWTWQRPKNAAD